MVIFDNPATVPAPADRHNRWGVPLVRPGRAPRGRGTGHYL